MHTKSTQKKITSLRVPGMHASPVANVLAVSFHYPAYAGQEVSVRKSQTSHFDQECFHKYPKDTNQIQDFHT